MKWIFGKSRWELWDDPLEIFLQRVTASGFEATEIYLGALHESAADIARLHSAHGLRLIGQILTQGHTTPSTNQRVGDVWEQNVYMRDLLANTLKT